MDIVKGDLIKLAKQREFDAIAQGVNCFNIMGAGISVPFRKEFQANELRLESERYTGDYNKLGQIDYGLYYPNIDAIIQFQENVGLNRLTFKDCLAIVNCYTQYQPGPNSEYIWVASCFKKINYVFKDKRVGLPAIGCGIGGLDLDEVKKLMIKYLNNVDLTLVIYDKNII